ncbi:PKD domain-containing protein, partial [bacterium]|nr:PKD domain-containing protein [bacterium]MBU1025357.1 PKD domain-containing protein [bacterium]
MKFMIRQILFFVSLFLILSVNVILSACSSGKGNSPISPALEIKAGEDAEFEFPILKTGENSFSGLIGLYELSVNPDSQSAEISLIRSNSTLGDSYQVDITSFLNVNPCGTCIRVTGVEMESDETLTVYIGARHPFQLPENIHNPQNNERLDLHVFDVQGIIVMEGSYEFPLTVSDINADNIYEETIVSSSSVLKNADGYTSILDSYLDTIYPTFSNIHPFKLFALDPTQGNYDPVYDPLSGYPYLEYPTGHNVFRMESDEYIVGYNLDLPSGQVFDFIFALSASYGQSGQGKGMNLGQRNNPRYFLPEFNRKEPWKITADITFNNLRGYTPSSYAVIDIGIRDWQHTAIVDPAFDFMTSQLQVVSRKSGIRDITIEIPGMSLYYDEMDLPVPAGDGSDVSPYGFQLTIYNNVLVPDGSYHGLIKVTDDLEGSQISMGIKRDGVSIYPVNDFSTYQIFTLDVDPADFPPTATINTIPSPPQLLETDQPVIFDATASSDDSLIVSYEWDFDFTGNLAKFHTDATGAIVPHTYPVPGFYTTALRVTDDNVPAQQGVAFVNVNVFCNTFIAGACSFTELPSWLVTSHYEDWETEDGKIDLGFLSNGNVVVEDNEVLGTSDATPAGGAPFVPFIPGYPGVNVGSIDVDRLDRVIWLQYSGPDAVIIGGVGPRNENFGKKIHVFDTVSNSEIATISLSAICNYIQAIETDEANNIWAILEGNTLVKIRASDHSFVSSNRYDLNSLAGEDLGYVFDFAINFYNDCFYVLTTADPKGSLFRFE